MPSGYNKLFLFVRGLGYCLLARREAGHTGAISASDIFLFVRRCFLVGKGQRFPDYNMFDVNSVTKSPHFFTKETSALTRPSLADLYEVLTEANPLPPLTSAPRNASRSWKRRRRS